MSDVKTNGPRALSRLGRETALTGKAAGDCFQVLLCSLRALQLALTRIAACAAPSPPPAGSDSGIRQPRFFPRYQLGPGPAFRTHTHHCGAPPPPDEARMDSDDWSYTPSRHPSRLAATRGPLARPGPPSPSRLRSFAPLLPCSFPCPPLPPPPRPPPLLACLPSLTWAPSLRVPPPPLCRPPSFNALLGLTRYAAQAD